MTINETLAYTNVNFDPTQYVSQLMVLTEHEYTKHYYIEGERICSKLDNASNELVE